MPDLRREPPYARHCERLRVPSLPRKRQRSAVIVTARSSARKRSTMGKKLWSEELEWLTVALMKYLYDDEGEKKLINNAAAHVDTGLTNFFKATLNSKNKEDFNKAFGRMLEGH